MNSRLQALVERGYDKDLVLKLASFTDEDIELACISAFKHISRNCEGVDSPQAFFIGGQPGCGKTIMSMNFKRKIKNIVEIGIDNYRMYHPKYLEIERVIREHWKDKKETENDSPGNDIADFTHLFAGKMTDILIEMCKKNKYNMIIEWGMREPEAPLKAMKELKENDYNNIVLFIATNKNISYNACNIRSDIMKKSPHVIRKVPKNFHDLCIDSLPISINKIYEVGTANKIIDLMCIVNRNNEILWDNDTIELPGDVYRNNINMNAGIEYNNAMFSIYSNNKEMIGLNVETVKNK